MTRAMKWLAPPAVVFAIALTGASCGPPPGPLVLELGFFPAPTDPCLGPTNMHLHFVGENVDAGAPFHVTLSGPALPASLDDKLPANLTVDKDFPVPKGDGVWTATVTSLAGKPAATISGGHLTEQSSAQCGG